MADNSASNKRIAKNTIFLYIRMVVVMVVSLYTTRLILQILGETDYGIYNIIGGIIIMFSFINGALTTATQRFLSYSLGQNDRVKFSRIFNTSIFCYMLVSIGIVILAETVGLWFVKSKLTIPESKMATALIVYQFTIATFIINILRIPFESTVIATEKMSFYAYLSVVEALLKLSVAWLLFYSTGNKLINYAALMMIVPLGCNIAFQVYCRKKIGVITNLKFEKELFKELMGYTSWSMMGGIANVLARQGGNILMNIFFGVITNAAFGIASQINGAMNQLVGNFQVAFRPQIIKLFAAKKFDELFILINRTSKFSFFLTFILFLPLAFNIESILSIWLTNIPQFSGIFAILLMCYCLIDAIQAPLIFLIYAHSNIKQYQIWLSSLLILNIPISYVLLRLGAPATIVLTVYVLLNFISAIIRTVYVKYFASFPSKSYVTQVIIPALVIILISIACGFGIRELNLHFILAAILLFICMSISILYLGLTKTERSILLKYIKKLSLKLRLDNHPK